VNRVCSFDVECWDALRKGIIPAGVAEMLNEQPVAMKLMRSHFPVKRPAQFYLELELSSGHRVTIIAERYRVNTQDEASRIQKSLRKSRNGQREALKNAPVTADEKAGLVYRHPGLDERLPGLRILYDRKFAREVVAKLAHLDPGPVRTQLCAHRLGKRAVIRIQSETQTFYARIGPIKNNKGISRFQRHSALWRALPSDSVLKIPEPFGQEQDIATSLYSELQGDLFDFSNANAVSDLADSIELLRSIDIPEVPPHRAADEISILSSWADRCASYRKELTPYIQPVLQRTVARLEEHDKHIRLTHRDLHHKQLLYSNGQVGLFDFDTLCQADPALDPGNLLAHLFMYRQSHSCQCDQFRVAGIALWRSAALLRLAMIYAMTSTSDCDVRRLIDEAGTG